MGLVHATARFAHGEALADALAPVGIKSDEVPVAVRMFLDRRRMMMMLIPAGLSFSAASGLIANAVRHGGVFSP